MSGADKAFICLAAIVAFTWVSCTSVMSWREVELKRLDMQHDAKCAKEKAK